MPDNGPSGRGLSRETRLLVLTITVSAIVLLLLAYVRFPEPPAVVPTAQPLERIVARAPFDELATSVGRLEEIVAPSVIALRLAPRLDSTPRQLTDVLTRPAAAITDVQHVPALRIDATTALAIIDPDTRITGIIGRSERGGTAGVVAADPIRRVARVRVPEGPARVLRQLALSELRTPTYVVAVEGTRAGVTLRPVFLGRSERFGSPRWSRPLLPLGGAIVTPGALMFTLEGDFLGCVVMEDGTLAIAGAGDVMETAERLTHTMARPVDAGISVQPLTGPLAAATGVPRGVVVADVFEDGLAAGVLEPGDVIIEIDGMPADTPEWLLLQLGSRLSEGTVRVSFARNRRVQTVTLPADTTSRIRARWDDAIDFEPGSGGTRVASLRRGTPFEAAGLSVGDLIVRIGDATAPTPAQVLRAIADAETGDFLLLTVRRDDRQRVLAVQILPGRDAAGR